MSQDLDLRTRRIVTPEGVALDLPIPLLSVRLVAFLYDLLMQVLWTIGLTIAGKLVEVAIPAAQHYLSALMTVAIFLVWNVYPIGYESRPGGATPGKRAVGIRVIDRNGGALRVDQVIVRNLVRAFEFPIPLLILISHLDSSFSDHLGRVSFCLATLALCSLVPLIHRDSARIGDLLAGTLVISAPRARLLGDLARRAERTGESHYSFTREQLAVYGVFELQVLEDLLRDTSRLTHEKALAIARTIQKKLGLDFTVTDPLPFLNEFYAAQRAHLEQALTLGKRRDSKHASKPADLRRTS